MLIVLKEWHYFAMLVKTKYFQMDNSYCPESESNRHIREDIGF